MAGGERERKRETERELGWVYGATVAGIGRLCAPAFLLSCDQNQTSFCVTCVVGFFVLFWDNAGAVVVLEYPVNVVNGVYWDCEAILKQ